MNWKILLFFMIAYYIELISSDSLNESSEALTWNKESQPERLYDEEFLKLLNYVSTLCESRIVLDDQDINLLSSECKKNINCSDKEASIKKYHDIMGEVLYVNKDYMRIILKNTIKLIKSGEKSSLEMLVKHYFLFVTRILSFLYAAQWTVPKWQIIFFLFLNDLVSMDLQSFHFSERLTEILDRDLSNLTYQDKRNNTNNVNDILWIIEKLYNNDKLQHTYNHAHHMTVQNVMFFDLYTNHKAFTQNSKFKIEMDWKSVNSIFVELSYFNKHNMLNISTDGSILNQYDRYNTLLLSCIQLRILFHVWFHVKLSKKMLSTYKSTKQSIVSFHKNLFASETPLLQYWTTLIVPLKHIMRIFSIKDDIYWSAIRTMMDDITHIKIKKIAMLEIKLRDEFLGKVKRLDLGKKKNISRKLKKLTTVNYWKTFTAKSILHDTFNKIVANSNDLKSYTSTLQKILTPIGNSFVGWLFNKCKFNEYLRLIEKKQHSYW